MISFPNAKINLGLYVHQKRTDGYHNITSCLYPVPWSDVLEIIVAPKFKCVVHGLPIVAEQGQQNLCEKAYLLLKKIYDLPPIEIHLIKHIPIGAGLGGGSADAACVLKLLNQIFELKIDTQTLKKYALTLGSDCPFFIDNKPCIATGRGEILHQIPPLLKGYWLALADPKIPIGTKNAYRQLKKTHTKKTNLIKSLKKSIRLWKDHISNDFETTIFDAYPKIKEIKENLYLQGACYASLTGSGSFVYGIFEKTLSHSNYKWLYL